MRWLGILVVLGIASPALAQRAGESAVDAAEDAFGTRVGNESIGLYGPYNARGFSPVSAGNVRIEGLYFDQQAQLNNRNARGNAVRVGISAQSYAFPAPTGIADFNLRLPGDKRIVSGVLTFGPFTTYVFEIDAQVPVTEKFSFGLGLSSNRIDNDSGNKNRLWESSAIGRLRPNENTDVTAFVGVFDDCHNEQQPAVFTGGPFLPPRYKRHEFFGQEWTTGACRDVNAGVLGRAALGDWTLRAGLFRSSSVQTYYGDILRNVQPDGRAQHSIYSVPEQSFASYSGEVRATRLFSEGPRRHTIDLVVRGRDVQRDFGGSDTKDFGTARVGERVLFPEPVFNFGPLTDDHTRQVTLGASYTALWASVGGVSAGVQKSFYRRDIAAPAVPLAQARAQPWLYSVSSNGLLTKDLAFYASYTRGLEDSGTAPFSAVNANEAMPASRTEQIDAGFRYNVTARLRVVAGVFQVKKPYFNIDAANVFGPLGNVRHRGVEVSLTGPVFTEGLTIVGGMILLEPRTSGDTVARGIIGPVPVGPIPRTVQASFQYQPKAWRGFGIDGQVSNSSAAIARSDNLLKVPGFTQLNLGARYVFTYAEVPASVRLQMQNVTNAFGWGVNSSGNFYTRSPRKVSVALAADF